MNQPTLSVQFAERSSFLEVRVNTAPSGAVYEAIIGEFSDFSVTTPYRGVTTSWMPENLLVREEPDPVGLVVPREPSFTLRFPICRPTLRDARFIVEALKELICTICTRLCAGRGLYPQLMLCDVN